MARTRCVSRATLRQTPADWSPDGQRIAFVSDRDGDQEIYVMKSDGSTPARLTNHVGVDGDPTWSSDSRKIAFVRSDLGAGGHLRHERGRIGATPAYHERRLPQCRLAGIVSRRRQDRILTLRFLVLWPFRRHLRDERQRLQCHSANREYLKHQAAGQHRDPTWSPDGRRIAYTDRSSAPGSLDHILVVAADGSSVPQGFMQGRNPAWRR